MKTVTITGIMSDFLDSIRAYERESGSAITYDERESSEFVNIFFGDGDFKIEEEKPLFVTEDGIEITDEMQEVITVDPDINKDYTRYKWANKTLLIFGSKDGADEYIWRNKPVFSYEDIKRFTEHEGMFFDIKGIAKERVSDE